MAHRTPTTARAMATGTPGACWPLATRRRSRVHRRTWAFQRLAWMTVGGCSRRRGSCRLPWAGSRYAQAPATSALRAWVFPALGLAPWGRRAPAADAEGLKPTPVSRAVGVATRLRSPPAATLVPATGPGTPRQACRVSTPGRNRHACTGAGSAGARRCRRAVGALTARTYAGKTLGGAGVGQTTSARQRRGAGRPVARPVSRRSCRRPHAWRRHVAS